MKRLRSDNSMKLWDEFGFLGKKRRRVLDEGWAGVFRQFVGERLPVEEMASEFNDTRGRPTKEIRVMTGALVLQQMFDLTDEETIYRLSFDIGWHYALDVRGEADDLKYVCEKTLRNYRCKVIEKSLDEVMFRSVTDGLLEAFRVPTDKQRLDSTHVCSNMRNLRRIELMETVIKKFLRNLKRSRKEWFEEGIAEEVKARYEEKRTGWFGGGRPSEGKKKLEVLSRDLLWLVERFGSSEAAEMYSYKQMKRVLSEQCEVVEGEKGEKKVQVRAAGEVPSDCLQNPADEEAAYDAHKGVGYQAQMMETYQESEEKRDEEEACVPKLITHVRVEPANRSDAHAVKAALEETERRGCRPERLTADAAYGSDDNVTEAREEGVELVSPPPRTKTGEDKVTRDMFDLTENECTCPEGQTSRAVEKKDHGEVIAEFDRERCLNCFRCKKCQVKITRKRAYLRFKPKQARLAKRRTESKTHVFREKYRWRAGVEATFSEAKRKTGMGRLRVRGLFRVRFCVMLKALGLNILRCGRALEARLATQNGLFADSLKVQALFGAVRNTIRRIRDRIRYPAEKRPQHLAPTG